MTWSDAARKAAAESRAAKAKGKAQTSAAQREAVGQYNAAAARALKPVGKAKSTRHAKPAKEITVMRAYGEVTSAEHRQYVYANKKLPKEHYPSYWRNK